MSIKIEQLKNKLKEKKIRPTHIRLRVLDYLEKNTTHPMADMIFSDLQKSIPTISKMSVYNTLNKFVENEIVFPVIITGTEIRYDCNTGSHHHFMCKKCNEIFDLGIDCKECKYFQKKSICGHKVNETHVYIKGICKDCLKREK
ncbi:Fur family transcriptional regulator [Elusimicrobiota bacterium]